MSIVKELKLLNSSNQTLIRDKAQPRPPQKSTNNTQKDSKTKSFKKTATPDSKTETFHKSKLFTGDELVKKQFDTLAFTGKFLELIGEPEKRFAGIIWGKPKGGKSNFAIRFADYLQEYFGDVLYIAVEEGESQTLKGKIEDIGGSIVTFCDTKDITEIMKYSANAKYKFVFIDSINRAGIDYQLLESIKFENPDKSFVAIVQANKSGSFKGDQALTHNCDFIIYVEEGIAYHQGRFGPASNIEIFKEPLYFKNKDKSTRNKGSDEHYVSDLSDTEVPVMSTEDKIGVESPLNESIENIPKVKPNYDFISDLFAHYPKQTIIGGSVLLAGWGLTEIIRASRKRECKK